MHLSFKSKIIKSYIALAIFLVFWILAFAYLFFEDKLSQKAPNFSWTYRQAFHQTWSFFSQPALYNDELIFIVKGNNKIDSVDVLDELWKAKRSKWNYARENVWDHILYRQMRKFREQLNTKKLISYSNTDSTKYYNQLKDKNNIEVLHNLEIFAREILEKKGITTRDSQFKMQLITNYTKPFYHCKCISGEVLEFETDWKYFNK